jgi:hypothetical protein
MTTTTKLTASIKALLISVREGVSYLGQATTYKAAMGAGWLVWEDTYQKNAAGEWGRGYVLTDAGRAVLEEAEAKAARLGVVHAAGCKCPRCQREHIGCRRLNCPTCG